MAKDIEDLEEAVTVDDNSLKCYMNDTGLMISHAFDERGIVSEQLYQKILMDKLEINAGMLMENIVGQMLTAIGCRLFFYSNASRENKEDRMEIDLAQAYIVHTGDLEKDDKALYIPLYMVPCL